MKSEITLTLRVFPVVAHDHRTGNEVAITVPLTKEQLRASQMVGQSSKELIERLCERQGYSVIEIGTPDKHSITLDLGKLVEQYGGGARTPKPSGIICTGMVMRQGHDIGRNN